MENIASFKVDHMRLVPGIYVSRVDDVNGTEVTTYDIRLKRPNFEDAMTPEVSHTIEHFGAMYLRNHPQHKDNIIGWFPMGCLTGFYLVYKGRLEKEAIAELILSMMKFIVASSSCIDRLFSFTKKQANAGNELSKYRLMKFFR